LANISPAEARIGYQVFLSLGPDTSREALQTEVEQLGVPHISVRMFRHYNALFSAGYDHYIPINRFDILRASEPFGNESANSRYRYSEVETPVRVTVMRDEPFTFLGIARRVSDAGIALEVTSEDVGVALTKGRARLKPGEYVRVDFLEGSQASAEGRVVDKPEPHPAGGSWLVEVEFSRLRSVVEFTAGEPMPARSINVRLLASDDGAVAADVLGRRLYFLLDAVENARAMVNEIAETESTGFEERAYPARIDRVHMDSPLEVDLQLPIGVGVTFSVVWALLKGGPRAFLMIQQARLTGAQTRKEHALARSVELDNDVKTERAATVSFVHQVIRSELEERGAVLNAGTSTSRRFESAVDQLIHDVDGLTQEEVTGVEMGFDPE